MTVDKFEELLKKHKKFHWILKFRVPDIKKLIVEKYTFELKKNKIFSYEEGKKKFNTDMFSHMHSIYRRIFIHTTFGSSGKTKKQIKGELII